MAYFSGQGIAYQPYTAQPQPQPAPMPTYYDQPRYTNNQQPQPQQSPNGFATVKSKEEALYWPTGPGTTMTFMRDDGNAVYIKTMGYNTAEAPKFDEYIKVEEKKEEVNSDLKSEIDKLWGEINALKNRPKPQNNKRREDGGDRDVR